VKENSQVHGPQFAFQPLTEPDLLLLYDWLNRPHIQEWWHGPRSLESVREEYSPPDPFGAARPHIAYLERQPAGYIQYYVVAEGGEEWWPDDPGPGVLGIDQFLADAARLGQGLGTAMVSQFTAFLFRDPSVTQIRVDPRPDNARAIRCYVKAGFREVGRITTPDGPALFMVLDGAQVEPLEETFTECS
jgi:RimJ/RimL family protein N-acetyltransferase